MYKHFGSQFRMIFSEPAKIYNMGSWRKTIYSMLPVY